MKSLVWLILGGLLLGAPVAAEESPFQVIVNRSNPTSSLSADEVAKLFLKKTKQWDHGLKVQPVDQSSRRSVRDRFSEAILDKEVFLVKSYWQKMIFSGLATPPAELDSDREVLEYVRNNSGAVGYVSKGVALGTGVKILRVAG